MTKFFSGFCLGIICGVIITLIFIYIGGGSWLELLGEKTKSLGQEWAAPADANAPQPTGDVTTGRPGDRSGRGDSGNPTKRKTYKIVNP
jgi:hypothetical protein